MSDVAKPKPIDLPATLVAPVRLGQKVPKESCGLFFPHRTNLPLGLVVDWDDVAHLIHLEGSYAFKEAEVGIGNPILGVVVNEIEYRVDVTSRYDAAQQFDPPGALVLKEGALSLACQNLGERYGHDTYLVPLTGRYLKGSAEQSCGFTRWSISVREGDEVRVIRSFEARPSEG